MPGQTFVILAVQTAIQDAATMDVDLRAVAFALDTRGSCQDPCASQQARQQDTRQHDRDEDAQIVKVAKKRDAETAAGRVSSAKRR